MKIAESWLRDWVEPDFGADELAHRLTMLGHEVNRVDLQGANLDGVVVGQVVEFGRHPNADRLSVCKVSVGGTELVEVVCGAPNLFTGMKSPFAAPGVQLPNGVKLRKAKIRGVVSNGMLCSAAELGLGDDAGGIIALPDDAPVGTALSEYLALPDAVIDVDLTPNRGDCFSMLGIAREVAALTGTALADPDVPDVPPATDVVVPVEIPFPEGCPSFAGRVIDGVDPDAKTPLWMLERLRRAGLRGISPIVDVTNYVMLELGQPLHAYDAKLVQGAIRPRIATRGDRVTLLDGKEVEVDRDTLVISDDSGAIGLAGIMGGLSTAVSESTTRVFFEAAFWPPEFMAGRARSYGLHTDASLRFERGVDPLGQARAVERASALLLEIAGGQAGPLEHHVAEAHLPSRDSIRLRRKRIALLLGLDIPDGDVVKILERLGLDLRKTRDGWDATPPSYRFDLEREVDLIEEIVRLYGYDRVPETTETFASPLQPVTESEVEMRRVSATLIARDYEEAITYSFIDTAADQCFSGKQSQLVLSNPISSEMSVMRSSLLPGLLAAVASNVARQQDRVRLFEIGKSFHGTVSEPREVLRIAGVVSGNALPEQWGTKPQVVDFFDIKSDVTAILELSGRDSDIQYVATEQPGMQPGQTADIVLEGTVIGVVGKVHPSVARVFELKRDAFAFELDAAPSLSSSAPKAKPVSKYPAIRRDIAVVVDDGVSGEELVRAASAAAPELIRDVRIFDIYKGPGIEAGLKSVAIGLILQETSRTLTDDDADAAQAAAVRNLRDKFNAELRD